MIRLRDIDVVRVQEGGVESFIAKVSAKYRLSLDGLTGENKDMMIAGGKAGAIASLENMIYGDVKGAIDHLLARPRERRAEPWSDPWRTFTIGGTAMTFDNAFGRVIEYAVIPVTDLAGLKNLAGINRTPIFRYYSER